MIADGTDGVCVCSTCVHAFVVKVQLQHICVGIQILVRTYIAFSPKNAERNNSILIVCTHPHYFGGFNSVFIAVTGLPLKSYGMKTPGKTIC